MAANAILPELLELNRRAVEAGDFEIGYHILAAALHASNDDVERIDAIIDLALAQAEAIDARPKHPLSSQRADERGTVPLFRSLVKTAEARRAQAHAARARAHHEDF